MKGVSQGGVFIWNGKPSLNCARAACTAGTFNVWGKGYIHNTYLVETCQGSVLPLGLSC